jgi:Major Facilitator Superfamily
MVFPLQLPDQAAKVIPIDDQGWRQSHSPTDSVPTVDSEAPTLWSPTGKLSFEDKKSNEGRLETGRMTEDDHLPGIPDDRYPPEQPLTPVIEEESQKFPSKRKTASWRELPRKDQLTLLLISRLSEPLTQTSLQSYMFYQLKSFNPSLPDSTISAQAGWMAAGFTAAQFCTAFLWGRAADSELLGRKKVILIGLFGTMISALGFGFSSSFISAILFRCIGGALNGNVGVMRVVSHGRPILHHASSGITICCWL